MIFFNKVHNARAILTSSIPIFVFKTGEVFMYDSIEAPRSLSSKVSDDDYSSCGLSGVMVRSLFNFSTIASSCRVRCSPGRFSLAQDCFSKNRLILVYVLYNFPRAVLDCGAFAGT